MRQNGVYHAEVVGGLVAGDGAGARHCEGLDLVDEHADEAVRRGSDAAVQAAHELGHELGALAKPLCEERAAADLNEVAGGEGRGEREREAVAARGPAHGQLLRKCLEEAGLAGAWGPAEENDAVPGDDVRGDGLLRKQADGFCVAHEAFFDLVVENETARVSWRESHENNKTYFSQSPSCSAHGKAVTIAEDASASSSPSRKSQPWPLSAAVVSCSDPMADLVGTCDDCAESIEESGQSRAELSRPLVLPVRPRFWPRAKKPVTAAAGGSEAASTSAAYVAWYSRLENGGTIAPLSGSWAAGSECGCAGLESPPPLAPTIPCAAGASFPAACRAPISCLGRLELSTNSGLKREKALVGGLEKFSTIARRPGKALE